MSEICILEHVQPVRHSQNKQDGEHPYLKLEILQNLDQRRLETGYLEPVLDAPNKADRIHIDADVFEQTADEPWTRRRVSVVSRQAEGARSIAHGV